MSHDSNFITLIGEILIAGTSLPSEGDDFVTFKTLSGRTFSMYHEQDCCESVRIVDVKGNIADLLGVKIVSATETIDGAESYESATQTIFTLVGENGKAVVIEWLGESNGYYSESVSFIENK